LSFQRTAMLDNLFKKKEKPPAEPPAADTKVVAQKPADAKALAGPVVAAQPASAPIAAPVAAPVGPPSAVAVVAPPQAAPPPPPPPPPLAADALEALTEMHGLFADGLISAEHFARYKRRLLSQLGGWMRADGQAARAACDGVRALVAIRAELLGESSDAAVNTAGQPPPPAPVATLALSRTPILTPAAYAAQLVKVLDADPTASALKLVALVAAERSLAALAVPPPPTPPTPPQEPTPTQTPTPTAAKPTVAPAASAKPIAPAAAAERERERADSAWHVATLETLRASHRARLLALPRWAAAEAAEHARRLDDGALLRGLWLDGTLDRAEYARELTRTLGLEARSAAVVRAAELARLCALARAGVLDSAELGARKRALLELDSPFSALGHVRAPAAELCPKSCRDLYLAAQLHALAPAQRGGGLLGTAAWPTPTLGRAASVKAVAPPRQRKAA
jgi:hypothetical protein